MILVRRRASTKVRSSRLVLRIRVRCSVGQLGGVGEARADVRRSVIGTGKLGGVPERVRR
jgi:hypothetical protein